MPLVLLDRPVRIELDVRRGVLPVVPAREGSDLDRLRGGASVAGCEVTVSTLSKRRVKFSRVGRDSEKSRAKASSRSKDDRLTSPEGAFKRIDCDEER